MDDDTKKVDNTIEEPKSYKQIKTQMEDEIDSVKKEISKNKLIVEHEYRMLKHLASELSSSRINNPKSISMLQESYKNTKRIIENSQDNVENYQKNLNELYDIKDNIEKQEREENRKEYEGVSKEDKKVDNISETDRKVDNIEIIDF